MEFDLQAFVEAHWPKIQRAVLPCFVRLSYQTALKDPTGPGESFLEQKPWEDFGCGFIVDIDGRWLFVTAAHVLDRYLEVESELSAKYLIQTYLEYGFHKLSESPDLSRARIRFQSRDLFRIRTNGFDYGCFDIPQNLKDVLDAVGVRHVPIDMMAEQQETFPIYAVVGIPEKLNDRTVSEQGIRSSAPVPVLVVFNDPDPPEDMTSKVKGFYGRVQRQQGIVDGKGVPLPPLQGMSGGPIFGLRINRANPSSSLMANIRAVAIVTHATELEPYRIGGCFLRPFIVTLRQELAKL
jgi:hypothetical protein